MLVFLALGWLAYVGFLLGALVLASIIWVLCNLVLWIADLKPRLTRRRPAVRKPAAPRPSEEPQTQADCGPSRDRQEAHASDIWPKWTPARRQYMDRELSLWQEQFDALNSPDVGGQSVGALPATVQIPYSRERRFKLCPH